VTVARLHISLVTAATLAGAAVSIASESPPATPAASGAAITGPAFVGQDAPPVGAPAAAAAAAHAQAAPASTPVAPAPAADAGAAAPDAAQHGTVPAPADAPAPATVAAPADAPAPATVAAPADAPAPATVAAPADTEPAAAAPRSEPLRSEPVRIEPLRIEPARSSLLQLAQPLWSDLSPTQQQVLEPFASQWNALPLSEKRAWADLASRFPTMKPDTQKRVARRVSEWAALTPAQRTLARANFRLAQQAARENVLAEWERYQTLTPEQRSVLGTAGSVSNTAARHARAPTGLARVAAQPLPRRAPAGPAVATDGTSAPAVGVTPTVGPPGTSRP
jgi:hypothetical protein